MNAIEKGREKIEALRKQLRAEAEKGYCVVNWMAKDVTRILEQTANEKAVEELKRLIATMHFPESEDIWSIDVLARIKELQKRTEKP